MVQLPGYQTGATIYESERSLIVRAVRESDEQSVIIKVLNRELPSPRQLARFQREYELLQTLGSGEQAGIVQAFALEKHGNSLAMVLEDIHGESLGKILGRRKLDLPVFLRLAIRLTDALGAVHRHKIIHKDINPANIVWNSQTDELRIIDFGISSILSRESAHISESTEGAQLEGTYHYMSPEQTGRMNRQIDYRTDFYSLGATLYHMLTGVPPFESADRMELVHFHIARNPQPPHEHNADAPEILSRIIAKLMAKTAEDRYQSAYGIRTDLERVLAAFNEAGGTGVPDVEFQLAEHDVSDRFHIPEILYGREHEAKQLLDAFERVAAGSTELMLVAGLSGIGKSSLVQEVQRPITEKRGYFIAGKFDQLNRNVPYAPLIHAFQDLVRQILAESEERVQRWRDRLHQALGKNGQVIVDVIPDVELIIGKQEALPDLAPAEAQNRFNLVFQDFISTFADESHPLVIFFDDLQWADLPSLQLIHLFAVSETQYIFIIGAYRDNEVDQAHPLSLTLGELRKAGVHIESIFLEPLKTEHVQRLTEDTLFLDHATARPLADLCYEKTGGNPFFLNQFLLRLNEEEFIYFDNERAVWAWELEKIKAMEATDNVIDLMTGKIKKLSPETQSALKLAACIGAQFDLRTLSVVTEKDMDATAGDLLEALVEGLIMPAGTVGGFTEDPEDDSILYDFLHDRVQQAAYSLIDEAEKKAVHLKIGRLLMQSYSGEHLHDRIFNVTNHVNLGRSLIRTGAGEEAQQELLKIAELNLIAGKKAKASAAYQPAFEYLRTGVEILKAAADTEVRAWKQHYDLALNLISEAAEAAYLSADFASMERLAAEVVRNAKFLDQGRTHRIRISALVAQNQPMDAVKAAFAVLRKHGIRFPTRPRTPDILAGLLRTKMALAGKKPADLGRLPEMSDPAKLEVMRIFGSATLAAYIASPEAVALIAFKQVQISVKFGNTARSAFGYGTYGFILCGAVGEIENGYKFATLAMDLVRRFDARELRPQMILIFNSLVRHWKDPYRDSLAPSLEGYQLGLEVGDLEYACFNAVMYCYISWLAGRNLQDVEDEMRKYGHVVERHKQQTPLHWHNIVYQTVLNMRGEGRTEVEELPLSTLVGERYDERETLQIHLDAKDHTTLFTFYFNKVVLAYMGGEYEAGRKFAVEAHRHIDGAVSTPMIAVFHFYESLNLLALVDEQRLRGRKRRKLLRRVSKNQNKLKKWAGTAPANNFHKWLIVEGERLRLDGDIEGAAGMFDRASEEARTHEFVQEQALANERAALLWWKKGKEDFAGLYMMKALHGYHLWGAKRKTELLRKKYPALISRVQSMASSLADTSDSLSAAAPDGSAVTIMSSSTTSTTGTATSSARGSALDLSSMMKASEAISGEIVLEDLLRKMMRIVIENAGAEKGFLLMEVDGRWVIEAEGSIAAIEEEKQNGGESAVKILQNVSIEDGQTVARSVVNYVARTREFVVLEDAARKGQFTGDAYVKSKQPRSVLCMPLIHQGQLSGIFYLENNLASNSFTPDRLEVLRMLSTQIANSLQNSQLYRDLQAALEKQTSLTNAYSRFVPRDLLKFLGKESIIDVDLGDQVQREMTVLFADIRGFTTLSESMTPDDNFKFINSYLSRMEPIIGAHHGFIDKYIGDAIMALFPADAENALLAAVEMHRTLHGYNAMRVERGDEAVRIGIGMNTGELMLGCIGGRNRMEGTVISDAVNLASRIEELNKIYQTRILIGEAMRARLVDPERYHIRMIDRVKVKGKSKAVTVYEVFDADPDELRDRKQEGRRDFERGFATYRKREFSEARRIFEDVLGRNPDDTAAAVYIKRCEKLLSQGVGV